MGDIDALIESTVVSAKEVFSILGTGRNEKVYQEAMAVDFRAMRIHYQMERQVDILYKGQKVAAGALDFLLDDVLAVELKVIQKLNEANFSQLRAYMRTVGTKYGVLIGFPVYGKEISIEVLGVNHVPSL